LVITPADCW